jgi:hypothetical protein
VPLSVTAEEGASYCDNVLLSIGVLFQQITIGTYAFPVALQLAVHGLAWNPHRLLVGSQ